MLLYKITLETDNHGRMLEVLHEITPSLKHHLHLRLTCQFFQPVESINKLSYVNYRTNYHGRGHPLSVYTLHMFINFHLPASKMHCMSHNRIESVSAYNVPVVCHTFCPLPKILQSNDKIMVCNWRNELFKFDQPCV